MVNYLLAVVKIVIFLAAGYLSLQQLFPEPHSRSTAEQFWWKFWYESKKAVEWFI